jgi:hypothetical protein
VRGRQTIRSAIVRAAALAGVFPLLALPAAGQDDPPAVGLDALLKIPPTMSFEPTRRGHVTKTEWRARFDETRSELATARRQLAETQAKLAEIGSNSSAWTMGAPGLSTVDRERANEAPLDMSLSKEMKQRRAAVERAEARMRELEVEANLAQVPEDWRGNADDAEAVPQASR